MTNPFDPFFQTTAATSNHVWMDWNQAYADYTTATTNNDTLVVQTTWYHWNAALMQQTATTVANLDTRIWGNWNSLYPGTGQPARTRVTPEEQAALNAAVAETERRFKEKRVKEEEARQKAAQLLREYLDERQRDTLDKHRFFEVVAPSGRRFRIRPGTAGNIFLLEDGEEAVRYCIHPVDYVPEADTHLAQALMIAAQEEHFEKTANKTRIRAAA